MEPERCEACGFDGARDDEGPLLDAVLAQGPAWRTLLTGAGPELRLRPQPEVWSAVEYAAHTRDVLALHVFGVDQALTVDEPAYPPVGQDLVDSAATTYGQAGADEVAAELTVQAQRLAQLARDAGSGAWTRGLTLGETRMDVRRLLEHALHDSMHHVDDVERGLVQLRHRKETPTEGTPGPGHPVEVHEGHPRTEVGP